MSLEYGLAVAFAVHACIDFLIARSWFPQEGSSDLQLATSDFGLQTFHHFLITSQLKINSFLLLECGHILLEMESILTDNFKVKASRGDRTHDPYWCETFKNLLHIALTRRIYLWEIVHVKLQLYDECVFARCYSSFVRAKHGSVQLTFSGRKSLTPYGTENLYSVRCIPVQGAATFPAFAVKAIILHNCCQFTQLRTAVIYAISEHIVHL